LILVRSTVCESAGGIAWTTTASPVSAWPVMMPAARWRMASSPDRDDEGPRPDRAQAAALFTQVVKAITVMETEKIVFRDRRTGLHANLRAIGNVALQVLAGHAAGNWPSGAASGISGLAAWDAAEGARFTDRYFAARAEATTALVQLSLMSDARHG